MDGYFDLSHAISISVLSVDMRYCLLVMSLEVEAGVNRVGHDRSGILRGWFYFSGVSTRDGPGLLFITHDELSMLLEPGKPRGSIRWALLIAISQSA